MAKFKVVSSSSKLKTMIKGLPLDPTEEGAPFKALRGKHKKEETIESVGIYVGKGSDGEFTKEKGKIVEGQFFQGKLKRSRKDPNTRLVLVTSNNPKPLKELVLECLKSAGLKHKVVAIKPGAVEPDNPDQDEETQSPPPSTTTTTDTSGSTGWVKGTKPSGPPKISPEMTKELSETVPQTAPSREGMGTKGPKSSTTETVDPKTELANRTAQRQEQLKELGHYHGNLSREDAEKLLNSVPGAVWLLRYTDNAKQVVVSFKTAKGEIKHSLTIDEKTGESKTREEVASLYKTYKPLKGKVTTQSGSEAPTGTHGELDTGAEKEWNERFKTVKPDILKAISTAALSKDKAIKDRGLEIANQLKVAEQTAAKKDFGRALSLLALAERSAAEFLKELTNPTPPPDLKAQFLKEKTKVEAMFNRLEKFVEIPPERLVPARDLFRQAKEIEPDIRRGGLVTTTPDYAKGIKLLQQVLALEPAILNGGLWAKQVDIKKYSKGKALKRGAFGEVYLLENKDNDPKAPSLVYKLPFKEDAMKELQHEAEVYKAIGDHPNIARCLGMKTVDGQEGLVMEAITGGDMAKGISTLRERLEKGEIKQEQFWGVMQFSLMKTLEALDYMSSRGFSHIDIKPDNIMFDDKTGEPKLVDMGLAAQKGRGGGGTPTYMSPEAGEGRGGEKSDVFSVGATAYQIGEQENFTYNRAQAFVRDEFWNLLKDYGKSHEDALHQGKPDEVSKPVTGGKKGEDPGRRKKVAGKFGANTEYTKFINWLMNPDPTKRPTAREALEHPFLKDRILPEDECRQMIRELHKK